MSTLTEYRVRIADGALNSTDLASFRDPAVATHTTLSVSSVRGGTNPYLSSVPTGDGAEFNPFTGQSRIGQYNVRIVDAITSGTDRIVTAVLFDSSGRPQLLARPVAIEYRNNAGAWATLYVGVVTALRLPSAAEWELTVSDTSRVARPATVFTPRLSETPQFGDSNAQRITKLNAFLARWPLRGCLFGGVIGSFLAFVDPGGFIMTCNAASGGESMLATLAIANGAYPRDLAGWWVSSEATEGPINQDVAPYHRVGAVPGAVDLGWFTPPGDFNGLVVLVDGTPYAACEGRTVYPAAGINPLRGWERLVTNGITLALKGTITVDSTRHRVRVLSVLPSPASPIYYDDHPVTLLSALWTEQEETVNATAVASVIASLGSSLRLALRITQPMPMQAFIERNILGPFGVGVRRNSSGQLEPFVARPLLTSAPATTITDTDITVGTTVAFELREEDAIARVILEHHPMAPFIPAATPDLAPPDRAIVSTERIERTYANAPVTGAQDVTYTLDGMVHRLDSTVSDGPYFGTALAEMLVLRFGNGAPRASVSFVRGGAGDGLLEGDTLVLQISASPKSNKRYRDDNSVGGRSFQIVRITEKPAARDAQLVDLGPAAGWSGTTPTITVAASSDEPRTTATVTISNAAALNAAVPPVGVGLQMATTTGAAPAAAAYTDVTAFPAGYVPTGPIYLPKVKAGRTVYLRARGQRPGVLPQAWQAASSVALTALSAPTGVGTASIENKSFKVTWTPSALAAPTDIFVFQGAADPTWSAAHLVGTAPAGSTSFLITGLVASTNYRAAVRERSDASTSAIAPVGATTATTAAAVTNWATAPTLALTAGQPPSGSPGHIVAVTYGHADASLEVQVDAVSNAFGAAIAVGTFAPGTTQVRYGTSGDGVTRYWRARHVSDTKGPSAWSATVSGTPIETGGFFR